jgi:hypothetical protein
MHRSFFPPHFFTCTLGRAMHLPPGAPDRLWVPPRTECPTARKNGGCPCYARRRLERPRSYLPMGELGRTRVTAMIVTWTTVMDPKKRYVSASWWEHPLGRWQHQSDLRVNNVHV